MTRTIKFRLWIPGDEDEPSQMIGGDDLAFEEYAPLTDLLSQERIMQWTGLLDINGVEIYEGDVLRLTDYHGERIVEVGFYCGTYYYTGDGFSDEYLFNSRERRVLGNVYANPELAAKVREDDDDDEVS